MAIRRQCEIENIVDLRHLRPAHPPLGSLEVPQTAAPSVVPDKQVRADLKPRNPFSDGRWVPS